LGDDHFREALVMGYGEVPGQAGDERLLRAVTASFEPVAEAGGCCGQTSQAQKLN
jgi:hypothetical protein